MHQSASSEAESIFALICYAAIIIAAITVTCLGIALAIFGGVT